MMMDFSASAVGPTTPQRNYIDGLLARFEKLVDRGEADPFLYDKFEERARSLKTRSEASKLIEDLLYYVE